MRTHYRTFFFFTWPGSSQSLRWGCCRRPGFLCQASSPPPPFISPGVCPSPLSLLSQARHRVRLPKDRPAALATRPCCRPSPPSLPTRPSPLPPLSGRALNLKWFFVASTTFLLIISAGLMGRFVHDIQVGGYLINYL